jgi:hypothetical protein
MLTQGRVVVASTRVRGDPLPARLDDWMRGRLPADPDRDGSAAVVDLRHR